LFVYRKCIFFYGIKNKIVFQILEYKTKFSNSETNIKKLKEIVTAQDKQLEGFEEVILTFKNKEKQSLENINVKQVYTILLF